MEKSLIIFVAFCSVLIFSCKKEETKPVFTISGHIFTECGGVPLANSKIFFKQGLGGDIFNTTGGIVDSTTTDSNGSFNVTFSGENTNPIAILTEAGFGYGTLMEGIPKNAQNLIVYRYPTTTAKVVLNVSNSYTSLDTLTITNLNHPDNLKVAGPFTNGVLYYTPNYQIGYYFYNNASEQDNILYKINNQDWKKSYFQTFPCDTSTIVVNIQ